ncbi:MAG: PfkB family carbohydrate kinase [Nitrososphaeraceae archaeon]
MLENSIQIPSDSSIVVMHDFSIDRIIRLKSIDELLNPLFEKTSFIDSSIVRGIASMVDIKGGNAINIAYCLAKLGLDVTLFTIADQTGSDILRRIFSQFGNKVRLCIANGRRGFTTAIEFPNEKGHKVNVLLSDVGDNSDFGPERISYQKYLDILANANAVAVVNWATNLKGSQLAEYAFKMSPKALHFLAPADIKTRNKEFRDYLKEIAGILDILSINENECNWLAKAIGCGILLHEGSYNTDNVRSAAKIIASKTGIRNVDLHTRIGSAWSDGNQSAFSPCFKREVKTMTGAGDSWESADIVGYLARLKAKERLSFSNMYASLYVSNPHSEPSTMEELLRSIKKDRSLNV